MVESFYYDTRNVVEVFFSGGKGCCYYYASYSRTDAYKYHILNRPELIYCLKNFRHVVGS